MKKFMMMTTAMMAMVMTQPLFAAGDTHPMHGATMDHAAMHGEMGNMNETTTKFLVKKMIDGYAVTFHVMAASSEMQHGGSHNVMVKIEKEGENLSKMPVNSKVIGPDGQSASKMLMKMGDWYMTGYDLNLVGEYQLMVLFKSADGQKHFGGVYYPDSKPAAH
ncbi:MAG: hypothetical protein HQM07_09145 [Zetaproteobacteria bacterium]|nr:hypothetical protein [Zetaproteobacteria bacterium]